ncbi:MAG: hypothetical protein ABSC94_03485 [Polyangiaceae bacterium]|jgi:hypothetical protein
MNARFLLGLFFPFVLLAQSADADDQTACLQAASTGQSLQASHKLMEARKYLLACAVAGCPPALQRDCAERLEALESALPTVVIAAKDDTGGDLVDVTVSVDGLPLTSRLDGLAVPTNAGLHTFHFESVGRVSIDRQVLVKEGDKSQLVTVVFGPSASPPPVPNVIPKPPRPEGRAPPRDASHAWRPVGWALLGAGAVGLAVGSVSGVIALVDKNDAHCNADGVCARGTVGGIKTAALLSDVGWATGGVLLGGGAALVLFAPQSGHPATAGLRLVPVVAPTGLGIMARSTF